tara:strand:+ start:111 stop:1265 length:1155 start_codon:yes stop_codon:yes gene_type:complete
MADTYQIPSRFYSLDVVRGILAVSIVFYHWQHFFYFGDVISPDFQRTSQPLYSILKPLYKQGLNAVSFFFSLSGFMFFWLYSIPVASKAISGPKYAALRFSRLYPLHLVTLVLVIVGQQLSVAQTGTSLIYQENDWYHLLLNILFLQAWSFEKGFSFNGPAWTVSIEVLMYVSFFVLAYFDKARSLTIAVLISFIGFLIAEDFNMQIGMGFHSFFIGGVAFMLYSKLLKFDLKRVLLLISPLCAAVWLISTIDMYSGVAPALAVWIPELASHQIVSTLNSNLFATTLVIPITIIFLALVETVRGSLGKRLHVVGDLSYALYLLHFPLQLAFILIANWLGVDRSVFYSITALICFFMVLWPLSYLSYFYFELPLQKYLRNALIKH